MTHPFFEELQDEIKQSPLWQSTERENQLEEILDACEAANARHLGRIDHLEGLYWKMWGENEQLRELVKEMYVDLCEARPYLTVFDNTNPYIERLEKLGFWDGEQND